MEKVLLWIIYLFTGFTAIFVLVNAIEQKSQLDEIQADQKMIIEAIDASHIMDSLNIY